MQQTFCEKDTFDFSTWHDSITCKLQWPLVSCEDKKESLPRPVNANECDLRKRE